MNKSNKERTEKKKEKKKLRDKVFFIAISKNTLFLKSSFLIDFF